MMATTTVRPYKAEDKEQVLDIFGDVWGGPTQKAQSFIWDWKHARGSMASIEGHQSHAVLKNNNIVGYSGAIPRRFKVGENIFDGCYLLDTLTAKNARGAGVRLVKSHANATRLYIGGANERNLRLWEKISNREDFVIRNFCKRVHCLHPYVLQQPNSNIQLKKFIIGLICTLYSNVKKRLISSLNPLKKEYRIEPVNRFNSSIDSFCEEFSKGFGNICIRNHQVLNWRFCDCPITYHKCLLFHRDALVGYAVYHHTLVNGLPATVIPEMCALDDKQERFKVLLFHIIAEACQQNSMSVQTLEDGCPIMSKVLKQFGFLPKDQGQLLVGADLKAEESAVDDFFRKESWYLSAGDSDFEFIYFPMLKSIVENAQSGTQL